MPNADDLKAYDSLPPVLRAAVLASPWPISCERLARTVRLAGVAVAQRRLRQWEKELREEHEKIVRWALER